MKRILILKLVMSLLLVSASPLLAKSVVISIPMEGVDSYNSARGHFYVIDLSVPADVHGKRLDTVLLEFAVDATALSVEDSVATPFIGAFPLHSQFSASRVSGLVAVPEFDNTVRSARSIAVGANRVVRMDITDIVKGWIVEPSSNHGLVIGSLTGPEVGSITLRYVIADSEAPIRVTFFYQNRFGDRISARE